MAIAGAGTAASSAKMTILTFVGIIIGIGLIAGMTILSSIPNFTRDSSTEGYGEEYRCPLVMMKSIYVEGGSTFSNGSIADNPALSTLSTKAYRSVTKENKVTGCIIESNYGWGPYNDSTTTSRRRRRATTSGLYSVGQMRCFYSTPCSKISDKGKYANATDLSNCVKTRLQAANSLFTKSGALTAWSPVPNSFTYSIVDTSNTYESISVTKVFGVRPSNAVSIATSGTFGFSSNALSSMLAGCSYQGHLSQSAIAAIIDAQYSAATTVPPTIASG